MPAKVKCICGECYSCLARAYKLQQKGPNAIVFPAMNQQIWKRRRVWPIEHLQRGFLVEMKKQLEIARIVRENKNSI